VNDVWREQFPFRSNYLPLEDGRGGTVRMHYLDEGADAGVKGQVSGASAESVRRDATRNGPSSLAPHPQPLSPSGRGEPYATLLCVHGNPTWSFYWRHLVTAFRGKYRVVVPDHVGCGLSDKPQSYKYRLARRIADLQELIARLDLKNITLLAHDWGGAIGLGAAGREPERFARLVLFNTGAFHGQRCPARIRVCRLPLLGPLGVRGFNLFAGAAIHMATAKPERFTPTVRAGYLAPYDSWAHRVAVQRFVEDIPLSTSHPSYATLSEVEQNLTKLAALPTMFAWGMRDWCFTPKFLERFLDFFPRAEVHRFADAGHYVVEDAHERIVPLVDSFIARHAGGLQSAGESITATGDAHR
jgi:pimeloyl-ACP methyl ester carboxylesterase